MGSNNKDTNRKFIKTSSSIRFSSIEPKRHQPLTEHKSTQELHNFASVTTRYQAALGDDEDFVEQDPEASALQKWGAPRDGAGKKGTKVHSETF